VKFQRVLKIIKHASATRKVDYEILTDEGDTYFTRQSVAPDSAQTIIFFAKEVVGDQAVDHFPAGYEALFMHLKHRHLHSINGDKSNQG
jgi:hypothetical protein